MKTLKSSWLRRQSPTLVTGGAVRSGRRRGALVVLIASWAFIGQVAQPALADGSSWTAVAAAEANGWTSVAYGDGVFVAVADDGTNRVMRSVDGGVTWAAVAAAEANSWTSVAYGDGVFVAVAQDGTNRVMRSVDRGATWSKVSAPSTTWNSVAYGDGVWVAVAPVPGGVMRSEDRGLTWTEVAPAASERWYSVAYGDYGSGVWVAVSYFGANRVMRSVDGGENWTAVAAAEANAWSAVAYGDEVFVAVAYDGTNRVMRSVDGGENWTAVAAAEANDWWSVAYGDEVWVAIARTGTNQVMRSVDGGLNWTPVRPAEGNRWRLVANGDGVFVAVAETGTNRVMRSGTWTRVPDSGSSGSLESWEPPASTCDPLPPAVGEAITCMVSGGDPGIDVLWRAAYDPTIVTVFAEAGVTLDESGTGTFSFVVPAAALGEELTVELVEWAPPVSLGVVGGPVPTSVPSGEGPEVPGWLATVWLLAAVGAVGAARRGQVVAG